MLMGWLKKIYSNTKNWKNTGKDHVQFDRGCLAGLGYLEFTRPRQLGLFIKLLDALTFTIPHLP